MKSRFPAVPLTLLALCVGAGRSEAVDFEQEIEPILNEKCFKCHSGPRAKGGLRMDQQETFAERIGGDDPVIMPGEPESSLLAIKAGLPRSDGDAMPPPPARSRGAEPMTDGELRVVKQWIAAGASFEPGETGMTEADAAEEESPAAEKEIHTWTNFEGKKLDAAFVGAEPGTVVLQDESGKEIRYPFDKLSDESKALARELATQ